jgi:hypothetical protein
MIKNRLGEATEDFYIVSEDGIRSVENIFKIKEDKDLPFSKGVTGLDKFIQRANEIKGDSFDQLVIGRNMVAEASPGSGIKLLINGIPFHLSSWSLNQLAAALHIPSKYARDMVANKKFDLFNQNFKSWSESHGIDKKFNVRTYKNSVRGILSTDYVPVDSHYLLPLLQNGLSGTGMEFKVDRGTINPEFTNIRIISNQQISVANDPHYVGFKFSTSDVGQSVVRFEYFIFRAKCTNGMFFGKVGGDLIRKRHTTRELNNQRYIESMIGDAFKNIDGLIEQTTNALQHAKDRVITSNDMERIMERFLARTTFGKKRTDMLFDRVKYISETNYEGNNLFSIANAITEIAQDFDIKSQEEAETFSGDLLFARL